MTLSRSQISKMSILFWSKGTLWRTLQETTAFRFTATRFPTSPNSPLFVYNEVFKFIFLNTQIPLRYAANYYTSISGTEIICLRTVIKTHKILSVCSNMTPCTLPSITNLALLGISLDGLAHSVYTNVHKIFSNKALMYSITFNFVHTINTSLTTSYRCMTQNLFHHNESRHYDPTLICTKLLPPLH